MYLHRFRSGPHSSFAAENFCHGTAEGIIHFLIFFPCCFEAEQSGCFDPGGHICQLELYDLVVHDFRAECLPCFTVLPC